MSSGMLNALRRKPAALMDTETGPTAGRLIYAVGDVHGRYDLLKALLALILEDCVRRGGDRRPLLIFCGDYVDRGPDSAAVLEAMIWLERRSDIEACFLKGNHEGALLCFLDDPLNCAGWLRFGGAETLRSYGVEAPTPGDAFSCFGARDLLVQRMPLSHLRFLERLELMRVVGDYAFVHAGINPEIGLDSQREEDLLWIRYEFLDAEGPFEKIVVHGHSWVGDQPQILPHRIGIDTGAFATGVLSAIRLDGDDIGLLQARGREGAEEGENALQAGSTA